MSEATTKPYINSAFDLLFIIGAPVIAFTAVSLVSYPRSITGQILFDPQTPEWFIAFSSVITHTHVMMVFARSHANQKVFRRFPIRFILIPILVMIAFSYSPFMAGFMAIVALYWDEWHTLMQTFGFSRIYDSKLGNDPKLGRKLDIGICFVLGLLPHMLLLTYLPENVRTEGLYQVLNMDFDTAEKYGKYIHSLRYPLMVFGAGYILFYLYSYRKLIKNGYKVSRGKIALLGATGTTAILIASFYSIADAGHFMNIYHSLQYLFIVCVLEAPIISGRIQLSKVNKKLIVTVCGLVMLSVAFVAGVARLLEQFAFLGNFWLLSSLLHFWYDGFIWSVSNKDV